MDAGLLIARLIVGFGLSAHGAQKLFGWFGGHGLKGTGGFFESLGFRPGVLFALAAGLGELGGGLFTAAGFLGPLGPPSALSSCWWPSSPCTGRMASLRRRTGLRCRGCT